ncbi:MAG: dTDP-4-dehydrorhamnose 3,5-epimerase family protein [Alphaproteobacteria bacterium]|nr:dTDP-4-dehydrorhamnose 3,5-epimerase family protein [Alphaproteobacteria bacterium]
MSVKVTKTKLDGVLQIEPPTNFEDFRGEYIELYNQELYHQAGVTQNFMQDDISLSSRHVLRGIHGDGKTWKLVSCLHGKFYLIVINNDATSPQYRQWESFTLSEKNRLQILIPPKFGNGHVVLTDTAIFHYKQTTSYDRSSQFTLLWNDPELKLWWPIRNPIVSARDEGLENK